MPWEMIREVLESFQTLTLEGLQPQRQQLMIGRPQRAMCNPCIFPDLYMWILE